MMGDKAMFCIVAVFAYLLSINMQNGVETIPSIISATIVGILIGGLMSICIGYFLPKKEYILSHKDISHFLGTGYNGNEFSIFYAADEDHGNQIKSASIKDSYFIETNYLYPSIQIKAYKNKYKWTYLFGFCIMPKDKIFTVPAGTIKKLGVS